MDLTTDQLRFFKENGYLIVRGVLDETLMERARTRLWEYAPPNRSRDQPATWVGPFLPEEEDVEKPNHRRGFRWQYREPGGEDWMVDLLAKNPDIWAMAEQMLGEGQLVQPQRIRGIYCTMPYGTAPLPPLQCHCDGHPFHLGVVGYIDDVPPNGGGFAVWPGSHAQFYRTFTSQYRNEPTEEYEITRQRISESEPVDCHGRAGDIVFWHNRLGHMAAPNASGQIRQAVLYDYVKSDIEVTQEEGPQEDMWRDWSEALRAV
jgi:hypothetical protein